MLTSYQTERIPVIAHMLAATSDLYTHSVGKPNTGTAKSDSDASAGANQGKEASAFLKWRNNALFQLDVNYRWSPIVYDARRAGELGVDKDVDETGLELELKARAYIGYPGEPVSAGDRAPEAPGLVDATGKQTSLFEIFKPTTHTLLVFVPDQARDEEGEEDLVQKVQKLVAAARASPLGSVVQTVVLGRQGVPAAIDGASTYHDKEGHAYRAYSVSVSDETQAHSACVCAFIVRPDGYIGAFVRDVDGLETYITKIVGGAAPYR